jgi:hypothetical protein
MMFWPWYLWKALWWKRNTWLHVLSRDHLLLVRNINMSILLLLASCSIFILKLTKADCDLSTKQQFTASLMAFRGKFLLPVLLHISVWWNCLNNSVILMCFRKAHQSRLWSEKLYTSSQPLWQAFHFSLQLFPCYQAGSIPHQLCLEKSFSHPWHQFILESSVQNCDILVW